MKGETSMGCGGASRMVGHSEKNEKEGSGDRSRRPEAAEDNGG